VNNPEGFGTLKLINWILEEGRDNDDFGPLEEQRTCADRSAMSPFVWAAAIATAVTNQVRSAFMEKNYLDITKRISGDLRKLRQDSPTS
jgi:hypothetical protein